MSEGDLNDWEKKRDEKATERGLVVVYPRDNELFVDIDDADGLKAFEEGLALLGTRVVDHQRWPSASGGAHLHIRVKLASDLKNELERLALQAMLGSDRKRELLCWRKLEHGGAMKTPVVCFFEKPAPSTIGRLAAEAAATEEDTTSW